MTEKQVESVPATEATPPIARARRWPWILLFCCIVGSIGLSLTLYYVQHNALQTLQTHIEQRSNQQSTLANQLVDVNQSLDAIEAHQREMTQQIETAFHQKNQPTMVTQPAASPSSPHVMPTQLPATGFVSIGLNHETIQMTLSFAVIVLIVSFLLFHLLLRFIHWLLKLPTLFSTWLTQWRIRHARHKTHQGLIEFSEGSWEKARHHLIQALPNAELPLLNYLLAAYAAEETGNKASRDTYLTTAQQHVREARVGIELQAHLQLSAGEWEQAETTLQQLQAKNPKHPYVLKLLSQVYEARNDWPALIQLLPNLKYYHVIEEEKFQTLQRLAYTQQLTHLMTPQNETNVTAFMLDLPKSLATDPHLIARYATYLIDERKLEQAEKLIRQFLRKKYDEELILTYSHIPSDITHLEMLEGLILEHGQSATLYLCLARLCRQHQLWGKAKAYYEQCIRLAAIEETKTATSSYTEACLELGELLETYFQDTPAACRLYKEGLIKKKQRE